MQGIKESSTLRVGKKGNKSSPKIIFRFGNQSNKINEFLEKRREVLKI